MVLLPTRAQEVMSFDSVDYGYFWNLSSSPYLVSHCAKVPESGSHCAFSLVPLRSALDLAGCRLRSSLSWCRFCKRPRRMTSRWISMKLLCWLNPFMFQRLPARDERQMVGSDLVSSPWWSSRRGCSQAKGGVPQPMFDVKLPRTQRNCCVAFILPSVAGPYSMKEK